MRLKPIKTEEDYHMAMVKLQLLRDAKPGSDEANDYEVLNILIEQYERDIAPMGMPDPIESINIFTQYFSDKTDEEDKADEEK